MSNAPVPLGRFLLFRSLKKGGMARVFLGLDREEPERLVAVKTLLPKLSKQKLYTEMFATEGKVGRRLEHPHIVRTRAHGSEGGNAYIALDFIFGQDLSGVLRQLRKRGETLPIALAVGLARDVCSALAYAHELTDEYARPLNIVNRDVSPGNIMIGFDGRVQLIDFGIAQTTLDVKSQIGSIKGKISYMAPEQVRGLPVDQRADVFSLGTVLYEMLTGVQVFHEEGDFATMERVRRAEAPPASSHKPEVDAQLDAILSRAMTREAHDRYQTAREMLRDLETWLADRGHTVTDAEVAAFLAGVAGTQIESMRSDIEAARVAALGAEPAPEERLSDELSLAPRLISDDALEEPAEPATTDPPADGPRAWLAAAVTLLLAGGAVVWLVLRGG